MHRGGECTLSNLGDLKGCPTDALGLLPMVLCSRGTCLLDANEGLGVCSLWGSCGGLLAPCCHDQGQAGPCYLLTHCRGLLAPHPHNEGQAIPHSLLSARSLRGTFLPTLATCMCTGSKHLGPRDIPTHPRPLGTYECRPRVARGHSGTLAALGLRAALQAQSGLHPKDTHPRDPGCLMPAHMQAASPPPTAWCLHMQVNLPYLSG